MLLEAPPLKHFVYPEPRGSNAGFEGLRDCSLTPLALLWMPADECWLVTGAAIGVLALSNGVPIEIWQSRSLSVQPQVWVSILSTVTNALLEYALIEGLTIIFWNQVVHGTMVSPRSTSRDIE